MSTTSLVSFLGVQQVTHALARTTCAVTCVYPLVQGPQCVAVAWTGRLALTNTPALVSAGEVGFTMGKVRLGFWRNIPSFEVKSKAKWWRVTGLVTENGIKNTQVFRSNLSWSSLFQFDIRLCLAIAFLEVWDVMNMPRRCSGRVRYAMNQPFSTLPSYRDRQHGCSRRSSDLKQTSSSLS